VPELVKYGSLPFNESIDFFRNKLNVPTERWADIWQSGHNSGFMVAGALKDDLLNDFRQAVDSAIAEGKSITWFKKEFKNIVARHGWSHTGDANWRSNIIYDTNMRQSYNAGRFNQLQHFDYWQYKHGDSITPRPMHLSWDGLLLKKDDSWWKTHFPQNGWHCKCKAFGRSQAQVDRQNLKVNRAPNDGSVEWTDKTTGEIHRVPKGIDPGFDYAPQKSAIIGRQQQTAKKKAIPFKPPQKIVPSAYSSIKRFDIHGLNQLLVRLKEGKAEKQVTALEAFLKKHPIKTLFLKQAEMKPRSVSSKKIIINIEEYLEEKHAYNSAFFYTHPKYLRANGFTSNRWEHLVVKLKADANFNKIDLKDMTDSVLGAIFKWRENQIEWSLSHIVRHYSDSGHHAGAIVTWLHELGHQVHFKAGRPSPPVPTLTSLTRYGSSNEMEWHAEHFTAWVLNREALAVWNKEIAEYFDRLLEGVI